MGKGTTDKYLIMRQNSASDTIRPAKDNKKCTKNENGQLRRFNIPGKNDIHVIYGYKLLVDLKYIATTRQS